MVHAMKNLLPFPVATLLLLTFMTRAAIAADIGPCENSECGPPSSYIELDFSDPWVKITATDGQATIEASRTTRSTGSVGGAGVCWTPCPGFTWGTVETCQDLCSTCGNCT